jgi:N-methylhydantoinase A
MSVEVVSWRMVVSGPRVDIDLARARARAVPGSLAADAVAAAVGAEPTGWREAWFEQAAGYVRTPVFDRYALMPGDLVEGPALVEERESTVVVPPDATARCDDSLNLIIDLR